MNHHWLFYTIILISIPGSVQADFIAFRKLEHPETHKIVYLLYDIHASAVTHPKLTQKIEQDISGIIASAMEKKYKNPSEAMKYFTAVQQTLKLKGFELVKTLSNLTKQHDDLKKVVTTYNISLIAEDWPMVEDSLGVGMTIAFDRHQLFKPVSKIIGIKESEGENVYYKKVTPLAGLGRGLIGKFTVQEFKLIPGTTAYFYNPDSRSGQGILCESDASEVTKKSLEALEDLFNKYNQSKVIIAEGYMHSLDIAHELVTNKGYKAGKLIVSDSLQKQSSQSKQINDFIKALENNNNNEAEKTQSIYDSIAQPIDLNAIFAKEFETKKDTNAIDSLANALQRL